MVHKNFSSTRMARVAQYNNSAQLSGDSCNTYRTLYPGSVKTLLAQLYWCWEFDMCLVLMSYVGWHGSGNFSYTRIARVAGYDTCCMLYLGYLKALLHSTTWLTRSMLWPLALNPGLWGTKPAPWPQCQSLSLVLGNSALPLLCENSLETGVWLTTWTPCLL